MSDNPRASAVSQRPGDSKSHNRGQQNYNGGYKRKSRGGRTNNYQQNLHYQPQNFENAQFSNVQHAQGYHPQQFHPYPHQYQAHTPQHLATGSSYGPIQSHAFQQSAANTTVRSNNIAVATNGISETNGEVDKTQGVPTSIPTNGYMNSHAIPHVNYQADPYARASVTSAGDMTGGQPQFMGQHQYVQSPYDPSMSQHQQIAYQNLPYQQYVDPYTGQLVTQPVHGYTQQAVHYQPQVSQQPVYFYPNQATQYYSQAVVDPNMVPGSVPGAVMPTENGNMVSSPVIHIQHPPADPNVPTQAPVENMEVPLEPQVAATPPNESGSYTAPVSVTFGQLADPNSVTSEQLTTTETESHVIPVAEEVPAPEKSESCEVEKVEVEAKIEDEADEISNKETENIEENTNQQADNDGEATAIKKENERMCQEIFLSDPKTWEEDPEVKLLNFLQGDSESDGECGHENFITGIRKLSFQPNEQSLDEDGERMRPEKSGTTVTFVGPVNTEYIYEYNTKSPSVPKCKKNVQKVTKPETNSPSQNTTTMLANNNNCEEKQVKNIVNTVSTTQKEKSAPVQLPKKENIPRATKKVSEQAATPDNKQTQVQNQQKSDVTRPSRTLTVSPVGISSALKDHEAPKRRPALPQADPRGPSSGPRPSPKPIEATPPKQSFTWASVASKGQKPTKQNEKPRSSKDQANGDIAKSPVQSNVDPAALQISSILDGPNKEIDSTGVPRGLINQANSCWVNSILQTALVCDPLYHLLCKLLKYTSNNNGEHQNTKEIARIGAEIKRMLPTCSKLAEVFDQIVVNKGGMAYEAKDIYGHISTLNPTISVGQQDAEEGLSLLLNAMHDEIVALKKAAGINTKANQAVNSAAEGWQISGRQRAFAVATSATGSAFDESPISAGFRGISQSSIKLPTSHPSPPPTEEPFFTLKVEVPPPPVPGSEKAISIEECLRLTPKEETLDEYRLKTGQSVTATRKVSLASLPPFLILHMKRFQFNPRTLEVKKIDRKVTVRERITIEPYLQSPALREQTRGGVDYELRGMVLHHGISAEGGHYTAEVKRGTKWYRIDDNRVSEMKLSEVLHADSRRTPYLLLWARL